MCLQRLESRTVFEDRCLSAESTRGVYTEISGLPDYGSVTVTQLFNLCNPRVVFNNWVGFIEPNSFRVDSLPG